MAIIEAIETVYLENGVTTSVTLDSIPATFEHLELSIHAADDRGYYVDPLDITFNSNTSDTYTAGAIQNSDTSISGYNSASADYIVYVPGRGVTGGNSDAANAGRYGGFNWLIHDYRNTNKNTSWMCTSSSCSDPQTTYFQMGLFDSTTAITEIKIEPKNGTNFVRGSVINLFGIKSS
tara:strand:+ start:670 stop:1203 length:534 start_codon:yes stop_codon:yes gene_type:complete